MKPRKRARMAANIAKAQRKSSQRIDSARDAGRENKRMRELMSQVQRSMAAAD